jgi:chemotaxis protein MotB
MARKKVKKDASHISSLLQLMTVSLFIILLAFFIMLNAIAVIDDERQRVALGSVLKSFGVLTGGWSVLKGHSDNWALSAFPMYLGPVELKDLSAVDPNLLEHIRVTNTQRGSIISIPTGLLFTTSRPELKPDASTILASVAKLIKRNSYPVEISGHVNTIAIGDGGTVSDREISAKQAMAVMLYFIRHQHIPALRITALGWGRQQSIMSNATRESRLLNQRIEILLVHKSKLVKPRGGFIFKEFFMKAL